MIPSNATTVEVRMGYRRIENGVVIYDYGAYIDEQYLYMSDDISSNKMKAVLSAIQNGTETSYTLSGVIPGELRRFRLDLNDDNALASSVTLDWRINGGTRSTIPSTSFLTVDTNVFPSTTAIQAQASGSLDNEYFTFSGDQIIANQSFDFSNPLDYNADNTYDVCVRATDQFGLFRDEIMYLKVNNIDEQIGDRVRYDTNGDGLQDVGEFGIS